MSSRADPEVEYTLDYADYLAFRRVCGDSGATTALLWIIWLSAAAVAGLILAGGDSLPAAAYSLVPAAGFLLLVRGGWSCWHASLVRQALEKHLPALPQRVALGPEGVRLIEPHSQSFIRWSGVNYVHDTPDHLFLFLGPENAIIVPRRAFPDVDAFDDFAELATSYHEGKAHEGADPSTGITTTPPHQVTAHAPKSHDLTDCRNE